MLVKYVRKPKIVGDKTEYHPVGVVVALSEDIIGWSYCCKLDHFDRERGKQIAVGRAEKGTKKKPPRIIQKALEDMKTRAAKYFKVE